MRHRWVPVTSFLLLLAFAALQLPASIAQTAEKNAAPHQSSGPGIAGVWESISTANWDLQDHSGHSGPAVTGAFLAEPPGRGIVEGNVIPYKPEAVAKKEENFKKRWTEDPEVKCYLPGVPRATYMPYPFQIIQTPKYILIAYEFAGAVRTVHMNEPKPNPVDIALDSWMGYSAGHWEGKTLVVEASHFNDQSWFDRAGNYHSDALKVVERYTPIDSDHMRYEAVMDDPKVFSRPWKISVLLYRLKDKDAQLLEFKCPEFSEDFLYGHLYKTKPQ